MSSNGLFLIIILYTGLGLKNKIEQVERSKIESELINGGHYYYTRVASNYILIRYYSHIYIYLL